jgi:hypothetical protein
MHRRTVALLLILATAGCGSSYTILDTSTLTISSNSRISAKTLIPNASKYPEVVEKLALAEEVYERQLYLLKERRNKLRARTRYLNGGSMFSFAATSLGVGVTAIATDDMNASPNLEAAGYAALSGLAVGMLFQVVGYMQEDVDAVDGKISQLDAMHNEMIDKLRQLAQIDLTPVADGAAKPVMDIQFEMSRVIQEFINRAKLSNVKG